MSELELFYFLLPRILGATFCGFIIGSERELKHKVAGIRTHIIVCVGACIFASLSFILIDKYEFEDPTRIIAQIVTGVGFLGAGLIFKNDDKVSGVTSAAFIWLTAAIGVVIGIGYVWTPIIFTIGLLGLLIVLKKVEDKIQDYINKKDKQ
ncbi:MAG: MgtC/SapB family protein [Nanoarchaeota archaeon]